MTRREMMAGLGSIVAAPALGALPATGEVEVAVVGAGAAGLAAARELVAAGASCAVLEARPRTGGRTFTDEVAGRPFDAGAAYVHFRERNPWVGIARDLGVALEEHRGWGLGRAFEGATPIGPDGLAARAAGRRRLWRLLGDFDLAGPDTALGALVAGEDAFTRLAATRYGQQAIGEEPGVISVADLQTLWDGDDYTVPSGYGRLVEASGAGLPVALATLVTAVGWGGAGVVLETPRGMLKARKAILTLPVGVLAAERVRFDPALPPETLAAIDDLRPGALTKIALALDGERFGLPSPTDLYETRSGLVVEMFPFDRDLALATIGGTPARELAAAGEAAAVAHATDILAGMLGEGVRRHVVGGRLADWWTDPHALGSYSVVRPGRLSSRETLGRPVADRLWFAGEATAGGGSMTVGGATLSGRAAARAVLASLRRTATIP